jgi:carboxyl-terminal processing protease
LVTGRVPGFEAYKVQKPIEFGHDLKETDFPVTDALFKELKKFAASKPEYKATPEQLERSRPFVERQLRFELSTAAYGMMAALQVLNENDPQIARAVDALPRARELAQAAKRAKARTE